MGCRTTCLIVVIALANIVIATDVAEAFDEAHIVPDIINTPPYYFLTVIYGYLAVNLGNELTPTQTKDMPLVKWMANVNYYYCLLMVDPDVESRSDPTLRSMRHWLVGNIPGDHVNDGDTLTEYIGAGPGNGTGFHRYVFLLYKQPGKITFDEPHVNDTTEATRPKFSVRDFVMKYQLGNPTAGNFFLAQFDDYVPILYAQLGIKSSS